MEALQIILAWLNLPVPRNYKQGVKIYNQFGNNAMLKKRFALQKNIYNRKLLLEELKTIAQNLETEQKKLKKQKIKQKKAVASAMTQEKPQNTVKKAAKINNLLDFPAIEKQYGFTAVEFAVLPKQLKDIVVENVKAYNLAGKAFNLLRSRNSGKVQADLTNEECNLNATQAEIVIQSMRLNALGWEEIRYWQKNKKFKREHPYFAKIDKVAEVKNWSYDKLLLKHSQRRSNIISYKKKLQKQLEQNNYKGAEITKKRIEMWTLEYETILATLKTKKNAV